MKHPYRLFGNWRGVVVGIFFCVLLAILMARALELQIGQYDFLHDEGMQRQQRLVHARAHRGSLFDRHGQALAISAPIDSIWAHPEDLAAQPQQLPALAALLDLSLAALEERLAQNRGREFVYLRRHAIPNLAHQVMALSIPGVYLQREYRRYYPHGDIFAPLLGFTDIDDHGQEGIELMLEQQLRGRAGKRRVLLDRLGREIEEVAQLQAPQAGQDMRLSIDSRIQFLAYRALAKALSQYHAREGQILLMDVASGELLAWVNLPSYNPNDRRQRSGSYTRNRTITDSFEPGSTIKPLVVAAALESGQYQEDSVIVVSPGWWRVGRKRIADPRDFGRINLSEVIAKSSNVGASKIALSLSPRHLWEQFSRLGIGHSSGSGMPGEVSGFLPYPDHWQRIDQAVLGYGYGLSVTALQLLRIYAAMANGGALLRPSLLAHTPRQAEAVWSPHTAQALRTMLASAVADGTGWRARVAGYQTAGKTGTVRKLDSGGYNSRYLALFAGFAPLTAPRLAALVLIDEPMGAAYYGGQVAAPLFAEVMAGALRLLPIPPDDPESLSWAAEVTADSDVH